MSGPNVKIITNSKGSGDYVVVVMEGETVFSGHSIGPRMLFDIMNVTYGYEYISFYELTDAEMDNWEEVIYG